MVKSIDMLSEISVLVSKPWIIYTVQSNINVECHDCRHWRKADDNQESCILVIVFFFYCILYFLYWLTIVGCKYNGSSILNDKFNEKIHSDELNSLRLEDILLRCMKHRIHIFLLRPAVLPQATDPAPSTRLRAICDHLLVNLTSHTWEKCCPRGGKRDTSPGRHHRRFM